MRGSKGVYAHLRRRALSSSMAREQRIKWKIHNGAVSDAFSGIEEKGKRELRI